jgi:hypothetical protein
MRRIHKISSISKYWCCNAAVTMMHTRGEFVGPLGRQGCHLQTVKQNLCIILCDYNDQENREVCCIYNVVGNLFPECKKRETVRHLSLTLWGVWRKCHDLMVRRWVRHFNEGSKNVRDDPRSGQLSVVNEVEEKIQENRWFTISSLSLHSP